MLKHFLKKIRCSADKMIIENNAYFVVLIVDSKRILHIQLFLHPQYTSTSNLLPPITNVACKKALAKLCILLASMAVVKVVQMIQNFSPGAR